MAEVVPGGRRQRRHAAGGLGRLEGRSSLGAAGPDRPDRGQRQDGDARGGGRRRAAKGGQGAFVERAVPWPSRPSAMSPRPARTGFRGRRSRTGPNPVRRRQPYPSTAPSARRGRGLAQATPSTWSRPASSGLHRAQPGFPGQRRPALRRLAGRCAAVITNLHEAKPHGDGQKSWERPWPTMSVSRPSGDGHQAGGAHRIRRGWTPAWWPERPGHLARRPAGKRRPGGVRR